MTVIKVSVPNDGEASTEVFTPEAIAGLVGQKPKILVGGDWNRLVGISEVLAAEEVDGAILLTLDVAGPAVERYGLTEDAHAGDWSIGYRRESDPGRPPVRAFTASPIAEPEETSVPTIPDPGFDPQPPQAEERLESVADEVEAGLAQPFADSVAHEQAQAEPLGEEEAQDLLGQQVDVLDGFVDAPRPEGDDEQVDAEYERPDVHPESPWGPPDLPFVSQHRLEAERLLAECRNDYTDGGSGYEDGPETRITLKAAHVEALLAVVEVEEYKATFLRAF